MRGFGRGFEGSLKVFERGVLSDSLIDSVLRTFRRMKCFEIMCFGVKCLGVRCLGVKCLGVEYFGEGVSRCRGTMTYEKILNFFGFC